MKLKTESLNSNNWIIRNKHWISLGVSLLYSIISLLTENFKWSDIISDLPVTLFGTIAAFLATEGILIVVEYSDKYKDLLETKVSKIESKISQAVEIMTIDSDDKTFENKLRLLRNKQGGIKWIISKFIARQLSVKFVELGFRINSPSYSDFSKQLYFEVDESLYLTNSFNPYEWVKALIDKHNFDEIVSELVTKNMSTFNSWWEKKIKEDACFCEKYTPEHIKAWKAIAKTNVVRRRLVVLHESELQNFFVYEPFYLFFKKINDISDEDCRFTTYEQLKRNYSDIEVDKYDYAIFDKEIALEWEIPFNEEIDDSKIQSKMTLIDLVPSESNSKSNSLKKFANIISNNWDKFDTINKIERRITDEKNRFIKSVIDNSSLEHSCCYHAYGGDCWENINKSSEYKLGNREQKFFETFLYEQLSFDEKMRSCNILHIGVGSGIEIEKIINGIKHREWEIQNYTIVDISPNILERTRKTINRLKRNNKIDNINFNEICTDVLKFGWHYERINKNPLVIVLAANGYLLSHESLLNNISSFMKKEDYLLVTTEVNNTTNSDISEITESYKAQSVLKLFNISLNLIGINTIESKYYDFSFNKDNEDVFEGHFLLGKWKEENKKQLKDFNMPKIKIFKSYKPKSKDNIKKYFERSHLKIKNIDKIDFNKVAPYNEIGLIVEKE